jgi:hypothetical protein
MKRLAVILAVTLLPACVARVESGDVVAATFDFVCKVDGVESFRVDGVRRLDANARWPAITVHTEARSYRYTPRPGEVCGAVPTGDAL